MALTQVVKAQLATGRPFTLPSGGTSTAGKRTTGASRRRRLRVHRRVRDAEARALAASLEFSDRVRSLYDSEDLAQGGIFSVDRKGMRRHFGLLSASIGLVRWNGETGADYHSLVEIAAEVKSLAKGKPGPSVVVNRKSLT